ncbi:MAG: hypothetical protein COB04_02245 [Gammaproteobacteria bacterium]|nr:MAG: hypothetical protein COB04_02245 [Gammaproteobacteria bacterium]
MKILKTAPYGFVLTLLLSQLTFANNPEEDRFNQAVSLYQKGVASCLQAHKLRASNLEEAKKSFQAYETTKQQAVNLSGRILTTRDFNIDRNIKLCNQAKADILRTEAIPIIETAIDMCKYSKTALKKSKVERARQLYNQYQNQKQQAFELANDVVKVQSIRLNIARCDKFENKLSKAEFMVANLNDKINNEQSKAQKAYQLCNRGIESSDTNNQLSNTQKAKLLLTQSKDQLASVSLTALNSVDFLSQSKLGKKLIKEIERSQQCHSNLAQSITAKETFLIKAEKSKQANALAKQAKKDAAKKQKALYQEILYKQTQQQKLAKASLRVTPKTTPKTTPKKTSQLVIETENEPQTAEASKKNARLNVFSDWTNLVIDKVKPETDNDDSSDSSDIVASKSPTKKSRLIRDWTQLIK